jgi:hypothetical protein
MVVDVKVGILVVEQLTQCWITTKPRVITALLLAIMLMVGTELGLLFYWTEYRRYWK